MAKSAITKIKKPKTTKVKKTAVSRASKKIYGRKK